MKLKYIPIFFIILCNCSFDDKSGIWKNENINLDKAETDIFKDFEKISSTFNQFDKTINISNNFEFILEKAQSNNSWEDIFYNKNNNLENFNLKNLNKKNFLKSKKLTNYKVNDHILSSGNNIILNDSKGNLIVYSINKDKVISLFNFYKKKYKKIEKKIYLALENEIIYVADNLGYLYSYNYKKNKIVWAKNFKIPFRSNLKLFSNKIAISNQNNELFIIDKISGNLIKQIPTEGTLINNQFINNIALGKDELFFLNTYGSLYSINLNNYKLNWFINLNKSLDLNLSNLFFGSAVVFKENKIFVSSNENFYIIDQKNGSILHKKQFASSIRPIIIGKYIFLITNNDFLISMMVENGEIIYSFDINKKISDFTKTKQKKIEVSNFYFLNDNLYLFLKNSYVVKFNLFGEIDKILELPTQLKSYPIILNKTLYFLGKKNRLFIQN